MRALLALPRRRGQQPPAPHAVRALRQQPARGRRKPRTRLMARAGKGASASLWPWLAWAVLLIIADQFTKTLILGYYRLGDATYVTSFFNVVRAHNTGAAFSFLADAGGWQRWLFTGIAVAVAAFILSQLRQHPGQRRFCFALSSILGGAIGNVVDRLQHGYVVDFLDFHLRGRSEEHT